MKFEMPEPRTYTFARRDHHSRREVKEIPDAYWHIVPVPPKPWSVCEDALCGSRPTPRYASGQAALSTDRRIPKGGVTYVSWDITTSRRSNTELSWENGIGHNRCPRCEAIAAERGIAVTEEQRVA